MWFVDLHRKVFIAIFLVILAFLRTKKNSNADFHLLIHAFIIVTFTKYSVKKQNILLKLFNLDFNRYLVTKLAY